MTEAVTLESVAADALAAFPELARVEASEAYPACVRVFVDPFPDGPTFRRLHRFLNERLFFGDRLPTLPSGRYCSAWTAHPLRMMAVCEVHGS